jgi:hypothetical protein
MIGMIRGFPRALLLIFITIIFIAPANSEIIEWKAILDSSTHLATTNYIGAGLLSTSTAQNLRVLLGHTSAGLTGEIHFIRPGQNDSAIFLFHNHIQSNESLYVNLGSFSPGTRLLFKYKVTIGPSILDSLKFKNLYTGQNRDSIDTYISERSWIFGKKWAAIGRINDSNVVIGFEDYGLWNGAYNFADAPFSIKGAAFKIEGVEKFKAPTPRARPIGQSFSDSLKVQIIDSAAGNYIIKENKDTVFTLPKNETFSIYYSVNGSAYSLYAAPISVSATSIIKAYAEYAADTNWYSSDTMVETYSKGIVARLAGEYLAPTISYSQAKIALYSADGKYLGQMSSRPNRTKRATGVYIIKLRDAAGREAVRRVVGE